MGTFEKIQFITLSVFGPMRAAQFLIVTDDCPYTDEEMSHVLTEVSLSVCKAYKEVPGLAEGRFDRDAVFQALVKK